MTYPEIRPQRAASIPFFSPTMAAPSRMTAHNQYKTQSLYEIWNYYAPNSSNNNHTPPNSKCGIDTPNPASPTRQTRAHWKTYPHIPNMELLGPDPPMRHLASPYGTPFQQ